jgi:hypothetical protein
MAGMTPTQQQTAVGEGLAIGCLALSVTGFTSAKMTVTFAFRHAWNRWTETASFPSIHAELSRNDILRILNMSERRRGSLVAAWDCSGREYQPYLWQDDWNVEESAEVLEETCGIPLKGWVNLAEVFTSRFKANEITMNSSNESESS